ncbi:MAG: ubiquinol-cytochrome c reductase iron-sulfur subunit, partial [Planctomycetota bacterium]
SRLKDDGNAGDFVALSSICPHLGCQVHWESQNDRFFCPCHNGAFDAAGQPLSGPPKDDNQPLPQFPLKVENNLLFIQAGTERLA